MFTRRRSLGLGRLRGHRRQILQALAASTQAVGRLWLAANSPGPAGPACPAPQAVRPSRRSVLRERQCALARAAAVFGEGGTQ
eukprot:scaffold257526_cov28-Tisochrysis_lutea.AAC.2